MSNFLNEVTHIVKDVSKFIGMRFLYFSYLLQGSKRTNVGILQHIIIVHLQFLDKCYYHNGTGNTITEKEDF